MSNSIYYGCDYNPEQWPEDYVDRDIELMLEAGVNLVSLGIFSWSLLEPEPGRYDLDWIRRVIDKLHAAGIEVDLATGTASPPPWLGAEYPETLPVDAHGNPLYWGSRQQYNPSSAVFREKATALAKEMASAFAHHPAVKMWHISNEYGCHINESFDEESVQRFRSWLKDRYGSLDSLNDAWGTSFWSQRMNSWDQVIPPLPTPTIPNQHQLVDWRRFWSDNLLELFLEEKQALREANPDIPITTNFMGLFEPLDYWRWAQHVDFVSNDTYPDPANPRAAREFALDCDLMRSLGRGRPFIQMEQTTSAVQWRPRNAVKRPGQYAMWSMQAVAHGADGILNFQWRQSRAGAEAFHGAMVPHRGTESATWDEVVNLGEALAEINRAATGPMKAQIAIMWDWESAWYQRYSPGPVDEPVAQNELRAWHASLFERGQLVDFVHPESDLTGYQLVIVPALFQVRPGLAARLKDSGATVLVTCHTGYVEENGHAIEGGYLGELGDLLGVRVREISPLGVEPTILGRPEPLMPTTDRVSSAVNAPAAEHEVLLARPDGQPFPGQGLDWAERIVPDASVEVVAAFGNGDQAGFPAITVNGSAWYVATHLDSLARAALLDRVLPEAPALPAGVTSMTRGNYTFLFNHGDQPVDDLAPRSYAIWRTR